MRSYIGVILKTGVYNKLKSLARKTKRTMADIVREALDARLSQEEVK